jgi:hypothetical protein
MAAFSSSVSPLSHSPDDFLIPFRRHCPPHRLIRNCESYDQGSGMDVLATADPGGIKNDSHVKPCQDRVMSLCDHRLIIGGLV